MTGVWQKLTPRQVGRAVQEGTAALLAQQRADGSFGCLQREPDGSWQACHPLFSTLTVLLAVGLLLPAAALARATDFVRRSRRPDGYWEFDPALGIPADADDTACALAVLARYGGAGVSAEDAVLLRSFWRAADGPFQTWRGDGMWSKRDRDDAVVNCNVLAALAWLGAQPTGLERAAVGRLLHAGTEGTRYYRWPQTVSYAARRAGIPAAELPAPLIAKPAVEAAVLPAAQWLSAFPSWEVGLIGSVLAGQQPDGTWAAESWFIAQGRRSWESVAITTALCVEALQATLAAQAAE
jgi:hypothetical protein